MISLKNSIISLSFIAILVSQNTYAMQESRHHPEYLAFWCALWDKDFGVAQGILDSGAVTTDTVNSSGETPLLEATHYGEPEVVEFLLSQPNINLETIHPHTQQTALALAAESGNSDIVQLLISYGASIRSVNFAQLFKSFKQNDALEPAMAQEMPVGQDEDVADYGCNQRARFGTYGKRGASGVGIFESTLTKRSRLAPEQEQPADGGEQYGAEPEFANGPAHHSPREEQHSWHGHGGANSVHEFDCLYNFSQNSSSQDNASQEDKESMLPAGVFARHRSQSPTPDNSFYSPQFLAQQQTFFPASFECPNCTHINEPGAEQCAVCGFSQ